MNEPTRLDVCGLVLAGGRGQRMGGRDKGFVEYEGYPLVKHVVDKIKSQVGSVYISANRNQQRYTSYCDAVINDELPDYQGPLSGILSVMCAKQHEWYLVVPCDTPCLPDDLLERLQIFQHQHKVIAVNDGERIQALCLLLHHSCVDSLKIFLEDGQRRVMSWLKAQSCHTVDFSGNVGAFKNVNRTTDKGF